MSFIAVGVGAATGLAGSWMESNAMGNAADKQAAAAQESNALQKHMYDQNRMDAAPWRNAGGVALSELGDENNFKDFTMDDFHEDPGYQFRMQEGQKALEHSAAARGGLLSGGTGRALEKYGQDMASQEYQNAYSRFNADRATRMGRLQSLAGLGQTAQAQTAAGGVQYANQVGQNTMGAANAQGAAGVGQAQIWGNEMNNLGKTWMDYTMMNKMGMG